MAFRTNIVPAIEKRTVSGSSVSFNSAFALPLKECKVSFSATQAGSGDPSPSNPRAISGVSAIGLTANSTPVSVSLGDTRYGGELDLLTGELTLDYILKSVDKDDVILAAVGDIFYVNNFFPIADDKVSTQSNILKRASNQNTTQEAKDNLNDFEFCCTSWAGTPRRLFIKDSTHSTLNSFRAWLVDNPIDILVKLATPQVIQLSANELSSIIGNNTFSTDTGTLEITFSDLQEKSASGAVATFNTALAMPLSSCNIAVNAWQEGSGDPSPSNVRPIHGFSEVNVTVGSGNLYNGTFGGYNALSLKAGTQLILQGEMNNDVYLVLRVYDENKTFLQSVTTATGTGTRYGVITLNSDISYYRIERSSQSGTYNNIMLSLGTTVKPYTPYVTPTIYPIQLGQEVYGAEVDVVNGVAHCTHKFVEYSENDVVSDRPYVYQNMNSIVFRNIPDITYSRFPHGISNMSNRVGQAVSGGVWCGIGTDTRLFWIGILDILNMETVDEFKSWIADNHLQVVFELSEQDKFDIQLTPTQIETLIGNNTIFADTGDVDLTYKDLDIAKRGSFREVFKLPS